MRTFWLFGPIAWNQSKGLILSRSSCSGQKRRYWNFFEDFCLASTLHEFTKRFSWKLSCRESCVWSTIISTRRMCHVRDYRQFTRKLLPNSKLRKRLRLLGWPNWIAWNEFLLLATLHINGLVNRNGSLYSSFFFAWSVKFSIGVAVVVS